MSRPDRQHGVRRLPGRTVVALGRLPVTLGRELAAVGRRLAGIRVVGLSAEIAFFGALAIVPMTLAVVALLGALVGDRGEAVVLATVRRAAALALVGDARTGVVESVERLVAGPRPGLLSVSVLLLIVFASRGVSAVMRGAALVYARTDRRPWWRERLVAIGFTLAAVLVVAGGLATVVVVPLVDLLGLDGPGPLDTFAGGAWRVVRTILLTALAVLFLTVLYHDARGWRGRWLRDLPGAVLATGIASLAAAAYRLVLVVSPRALASSGQEDDLVGAVLLGILATLVLLALVGGSVLLGAAFNAARDPTVGETGPPDETQRSRSTT